MVLPLFREGSTQEVRQEIDPVPDYIPPGAEGPPLTMISPKPHAFLNSTYANQERQQTIEGPQPVMMNAADAAARAIVPGDPVRVFNGTGSFR